MATGLGALVVSLGLDAGEYIRGLTASEKRAKDFARQLEQGISRSASAAGVAIAGIGVAAAGALVAMDQLVKSASKFKDLEEITGGSAESLAGLAVAAGVAGSDMDTIAAASVKLSKTLVGVDDESKAVGAALAALGIPIEKFKQLDPASQFEAVGKALGGFADGSSKAAVAAALYGKEGAKLLPFLKQLTEDGGRTIILTQQQIEAADAYADAQAKLRAQISLYAQAAATEALPALNALTKATRDTVGELIGLDQQSRRLDGAVVAAFAEKTVTALGFVVDAAQGVGRAFQFAGTAIGAELAVIERARALDFKGAKEIALQARQDLENILTKPLFSQKLAQNIADAKALAAAPFPQQPDRRPNLNFNGPAPKARTGGASSERLTEAQRYLESLQRQLDRTKELSTVETVLSDIQSGRLTLSKGVTEQVLVGVAKQIDFQKQLKQDADEQIKQAGRMFEAQQKAEQAAANDLLRRIDASERAIQSAQDMVDTLEVEVSVIGQGNLARELALSQLERQRALTLAVNEADAAQLKGIYDRRDALLKAGDALSEQFKKQQEVADSFRDSFTNSFADVLDGTKSLSQAFKSFVNDLQRDLNRIASRTISDALFGKQGEGFGGFFGSALKDFFSGIKFPGFAAGGTPAVGKLSIVGENGPEFFVPKVAGTIVPNEVFQAARAQRSVTQVFNINVPASTSRQTASQIGRETARHLQFAMRDG